jgi:hypothetical protein
MKNSLISIFALSVLVFAGLGCGILDRATGGTTESNATNANKSLTDRAVDTAVGHSKIGIPECDEAMDILEAQANNPDDNFVTKAVKQTALNKFREQLKKALEDNQNNKAEVAKFCREFKQNIVDNLGNSNTNSGK